MTALLVVVVLGGITGAVLRVLGRRRDERRRRQAARELPGVVTDLARSLRTGATLDVALREIAPHVVGVLGDELDGVVGMLERGHGLRRSLEVWSRASLVDGVGLLVAACRFPLGRGSGLDRALDGVSATLLDRLELADELRALSIQARTSVAVLVALPPAGAVVFALVDPGFVGVLGTTIGRACLVLGVALDLAGAQLSRLLVRRCLHGAVAVPGGVT